MNLRYSITFLTLTGTMLCILPVQLSEAGARKNFSRYQLDQAAMTAKQDDYRPPRKKRKLVKTDDVAGQPQAPVAKAKPGSVTKLAAQTPDSAIEEGEGKRQKIETTDAIALEKRRLAATASSQPEVIKEQITATIIARAAKNQTVDAGAEKQPDTSVTISIINSGEPGKVASIDIAPDESVSAKPKHQSPTQLTEKVVGSDENSKSCNKAKLIISKYAFADVEAKSCKGKIYHFFATRGGKKFSIKISALTNELIEVTKVLPNNL
jgi:hypothetical protein